MYFKLNYIKINDWHKINNNHKNDFLDIFCISIYLNKISFFKKYKNIINILKYLIYIFNFFN